MHEFGASAEQAAAAYLRRKGCRLLETNYHTRRGEIDIICRDGDSLVFVEVKSTRDPDGWYPGDRIDKRKRKRIQLAASHYISHHEIPAGAVRFDAVLMTATRRGEWKINHVRDAFRIDESNV
ncbi:MAG TPA: YraN family protein [Bacteroidetes bacterium]|nr:YraN family protein [Bacteroidota bacterium]